MTTTLFTYEKGDTLHFILSYNGDAIKNNDFNSDNGGFTKQFFSEDRRDAINTILANMKGWKGNIEVTEESFGTNRNKEYGPVNGGTLFSLVSGVPRGELK